MLNQLEQKLKNHGFSKLLEKENKIYYHKIKEFPSRVQQISIVYDANKDIIASIDIYEWKDGELNIQKGNIKNMIV